MDRVFLSSRAIDKESLCISAGKLVWEVTISITILSYDGNWVDPVMYSALLCISTTKLPQVRVKSDNKVQILTEDKPWKPINVHHFPLPVTF